MQPPIVFGRFWLRRLLEKRSTMPGLPPSSPDIQFVLQSMVKFWAMPLSVTTESVIGSDGTTMLPFELGQLEYGRLASVLGLTLVLLVADTKAELDVVEEIGVEEIGVEEIGDELLMMSDTL